MSQAKTGVFGKVSICLSEPQGHQLQFIHDGPLATGKIVAASCQCAKNLESQPSYLTYNNNAFRRSR
jgi:hypothetical protein